MRKSTIASELRAKLQDEYVGFLEAYPGRLAGQIGLPAASWAAVAVSLGLHFAIA
ncbi:MAG: hypothetical protein V2A73_12705 [Pseudomonadota bacterium]